MIGWTNHDLFVKGWRNYGTNLVGYNFHAARMSVSINSKGEASELLLRED